MINDIKNFFLLTIFTISFVVVADNPGDIVVSEETEAVTEEVVEDDVQIIEVSRNSSPAKISSLI